MRIPVNSSHQLTELLKCSQDSQGPKPYSASAKTPPQQGSLKSFLSTLAPLVSSLPNLPPSIRSMIVDLGEKQCWAFSLVRVLPSSQVEHTLDKRLASGAKYRVQYECRMNGSSVVVIHGQGRWSPGRGLTYPSLQTRMLHRIMPEIRGGKRHAPPLRRLEACPTFFPRSSPPVINSGG